MEHLDGYAVRLRAWWADGNDLLLTPTMRRPPVPLGDPDGSATGGAGIAFTAPFNISGQPAISLPVHWSEDGLPIGVQLVAAPDREDLLLRVAAALEEAVGWQRRRPPIHATVGAPAQPPSEE
jgi:amidase